MAVPFVLMGSSPAGGSAGRWLSEHREMAGAYLAETASARAVAHVILLGLGALSGLAALGAVRAAQVFYGPLNTLFDGIYLALVPDGVKRRDDPVALRRLMVTATVVVTAVALAWMVVGLALPDEWGARLFGETWAEAEDVMLPIGLSVVAGSLATGAFGGLRSLAAARLSLRARLWSLPPQAVGALGGAAAAAAVGYSVGLAIGKAVMAAIWWVFFASALRRRREGHEPAAEPVHA
jgi:O-antigen/teichoic acid export membrane protein